MATELGVARMQTRAAQSTVTTPWRRLLNSTRRVDVARVNWPGLLYLQIKCGTFDPRPRVRKAEGQRVVTVEGKPADLTMRMYVRAGTEV